MREEESNLTTDHDSNSRKGNYTMARDFARSFYNGKTWRKTRESYYNSQFGICERCGNPGKIVHHKQYITPDNINDPTITLSFDNLELLCKPCHDAEHEVGKYWREYKQKPLTPGYTFDECGNLVPAYDVSIVYGAPGSGKTTYVREHMTKGDMIVDLDILLQSITDQDMYEGNKDLMPYVFDMRDALYDGIEKRKASFNHCWIIAGLPSKAERKMLAERMKAKLIYIEATKEECTDRILSDNKRSDKHLHLKYLNNYFKRFEK